jgi:subtilase family serine protease
MRRIAAVGSVAGGVGLLAALLLAAGAQAAASSTGLTQANERVCGTPAAGQASCFAIRHYGASPAARNGSHKPHTESPPPVKYGAAELQAAYGLASAAASSGAGRTVAIVDAYDDPNAYEDLSHYRTTEELGGIHQCKATAFATSEGPCFAKVNQAGKEGSDPSGNTGWAEEISLDVDMVSAICPNCNILLVEAESNSFLNLATAVDTAAGFHPVAIGNSYGGSEFSSEELFGETYFAHSGVAITAASGDNGYGVEFPAAAASVIAVGGTSLRNEGGWKQTVWSGTGSGCSAYVEKPSWQVDPACSRRTVADVAADADPNTGVKVYDTYNEPGEMVFGGTSVSAQIIAGVYGLAGSGASDASGLYLNGGSPFAFGTPNPSLYDVQSGSNGSCAGHGRFVNTSLAYLCTGVTGYDGPTGMGTPKGTLTPF